MQPDNVIDKTVKCFKAIKLRYYSKSDCDDNSDEGSDAEMVRAIVEGVFKCENRPQKHTQCIVIFYFQC